MRSRRGFMGCVLCTAVGLVATRVEAQTGGVSRKMLGTIDYPGDGKVSILMTVEIAPNAVIARHTHPGVESWVVMEGEVMLEVEGQPARTYKVGEGFQVPPGVPHGGKNGPATSKIAATFIVEKDKPLASPA
ncbi:cupin domain-containing protein [Belnapia moabensis]|uniref:cupin domain-containing protein n=1 Tax=Belnapia moabensis TaxID=365533 RepID=UPI0005B7D0E3|nr:cupin domain-containing protein [Belnapia moabensis]